MTSSEQRRSWLLTDIVEEAVARRIAEFGRLPSTFASEWLES